MKTKIAYIGKFQKMWDEEYIARGFEMIGCDVLRVPENTRYTTLMEEIDAYSPDYVFWAKFNVANPLIVLNHLKKKKYKTVCWVFDLYFNYQREYQIDINPMFKADIVISTEGGHQKEWENKGIRHYCVRQGIYDKECYKIENEKEIDVLFVGSENPFNQRQEILKQVAQDFNLTWVGRQDTDEVRGAKLNELFSKTKVVIGDSVDSPLYWSNRIVETLGRGGFLIHKEVKGLKEEYPYLVTYTDYKDLKKKIKFYLKNDKKRQEIIEKNFEWVKNKYLISHQCKKILNICKKSQKTK